jgi:hypothetical protein
VLNKVALSAQLNMKTDLREIYGASTRAPADAAIDVFADKWSCDSLVNDGAEREPFRSCAILAGSLALELSHEQRRTAKGGVPSSGSREFRGA